MKETQSSAIDAALLMQHQARQIQMLEGTRSSKPFSAWSGTFINCHSLTNTGIQLVIASLAYGSMGARCMDPCKAVFKQKGPMSLTTH